MAVSNLQIDIPDENAIVEFVETDNDGGHNDDKNVETPMDTEDMTVSKDTTTSEETDANNSSTEIVAVADVHVGGGGHRDTS